MTRRCRDRVVFRKYWSAHSGWTPIAFLPDCEARPGFLMSYEHCGQHSEACLDYYRTTRPCTDPAVYGPLLAELERRGYDLRIVQKIIPERQRRPRWD